MNIWNYISDRYFADAAAASVLEIGPLDGRFSDLLLSRSPEKLTLMEFDQRYSSMLTQRYQHLDHVSVLHADMHRDLAQAGPHHLVVALGVIYHSHAPLHLLEEIVNVCRPHVLLLDAPGSEPGNVIKINAEEPNLPGMRFTNQLQCCKITMNLGHDIIVQAMCNMGYVLDQFEILPGLGEIKVSRVPFFKFKKI